MTKIYLIDKHIEFCTNCRTCTQQEGSQRGQCPIDDDMQGILQQIERSDAIVLASPMNFWTVTAVMKRFIERLVCFAYWPWGRHAPKIRKRRKTKRAVVVISSAAPLVVGPAVYADGRPFERRYRSTRSNNHWRANDRPRRRRAASRVKRTSQERRRRLGKKLASRHASSA